MLYWTIFLAGMSLKEALDCGSAAIAITWLLGPTPAHMPNVISVGPAVLPQCIVVTNAQTDCRP